MADNPVAVTIENEYSPTTNSDNSADIPLPGSKIRPIVKSEDVENLAERLYGIIPSEMKELVSYDDRNFLIYGDTNVKNPLITNKWEHGHVLKIVNSLDSKQIDFIDAQTELLLHARKHGITCPNPVKNVYGKYTSLETLNGSRHVVRLYEFQPGLIFHEVENTENLFYQCGEFIAKLDHTFKSFDSDVLKNRRTLWMLHSVPQLKEFLYIVKDHSRKMIVEEVIEAVEEKILSKLDSLETGVIHGDFNEQNIIVTKPKGREEYRIVGVIDFGDISVSPYMFELAIAMTYMMLQSADLATGGLVLAGYKTIRNIPDDKGLLKYCVAARLCQSLVLGAYSHSLYPDNAYLLTTQKIGWELLESLWRDNLNNIDNIWEDTCDNYLKRSYK